MRASFEEGMRAKQNSVPFILTCAPDVFNIILSPDWYYVIESAETEIDKVGQTYITITTWQTKT